MQNDEVIKFNEHRKLQELLKVTFQFVKQEFKSLIKIILVLALPLMLLLGTLLGIFQSELVSFIGEPRNLSNFFEDMFFKFGLLYSLFTLIHYILYVLFMTISIAYVVEYINNGPNVPLSNIIFQLKEFLPRIILLTLITSAITYVSLILIIPGIYFGIAFSLSTMILIIEDTNITTSIKRSMYFIKGYWWQTLGYILVLSIIGIVAYWIFSLPIYYMNGKVLESAFFTNTNNTLLLLLYIVFSIIASLAYIFLVVVGIFFSFYYFSQYEIKEIGHPSLINTKKN